MQKIQIFIYALIPSGTFRVLEAGEPSAPSERKSSGHLRFVDGPLVYRNPDIPFLFRIEREHIVEIASPPRPCTMVRSLAWRTGRIRNLSGFLSAIFFASISCSQKETALLLRNMSATMLLSERTPGPVAATISSLGSSDVRLLPACGMPCIWSGYRSLGTQALGPRVSDTGALRIILSQ